VLSRPKAAPISSAVRARGTWRSRRPYAGRAASGPWYGAGAPQAAHVWTAAADGARAYGRGFTLPRARLTNVSGSAGQGTSLGGELAGGRRSRGSRPPWPNWARSAGMRETTRRH
jgi:hypothetical protein